MATAADSTARMIASHSEMVIAWWRDWSRFLTLRLRLLDLTLRQITGATDDALPAFDRDQHRDATTERELRTALDRIPAARRTVFEAELDTRMASVQQQLAPNEAATLDRFQLERVVLEQLQGEASGETDANHEASTPTEGGVWFSFDASVLSQVPEEAAYTIATPPRRRLPTANLILLVVLITIIWGGVAFVVLIRPRMQTVAPPDTPPVAMVNATPLQPWPIRALRIGEADVPVARIDDTAWPAVPEATAGWRMGSIWPIELCIPGELAQAHPTAIQLLGANGALDRSFALTTDAPPHPDMRLVVCGSGILIASGILEATTPQVLVEPGVAQSIPQLGELTLTGVHVTTAAQDATIAPGRDRISIILAAPDGVDWPGWLPVLRFIDGGEARLVDSHSEAGAVTLSYDIAAERLTGPTPVVWQITDPHDTGASYRWKLEMSAP